MVDFRQPIYQFLNQLFDAREPLTTDFLRQHMVKDCQWNISHPIGDCQSIDAVISKLVEPIRSSLSGCHRRDLVFIGGENIRENGGHWVASVTHYVGNFVAPLFGIAPNHKLVFLRAGEFYRIENNQITEAKIIVDVLDLIRQTQPCKIPLKLGNEITFPAPATQDGLLPSLDNSISSRSLDIVQAMLGDLHVYDPETNDSTGQTGKDGYWHENMLWYGPAGVGSNCRWEGFVKDHRAAFLQAFPDRQGGNHYCRIGNGNYAAVSGWPSMTMTHRGEYLGVPATNKSLTLRVMDFYRCTERQIMENWVLLDYADLLYQLDIDVIALHADDT